MTEYAAKLAKRAMTTDERMMAEQYIAGAREAGYKVTRENVRKVFPPGVSDLVMRYLRGV
jgi:tripartite-type tricarboxylate transporter receptor subunit TctC